MPQVTLGAAIGVSGQQIRKYEGGIDRISSSRLYLTARALGYDISAFFPEYLAFRTAKGMDV